MKLFVDKVVIGELVIHQGLEYLEKQRIAGKVASGALKLLKDSLVTENNLIKLNKLAEEYIIDNGCYPTFKGYKGFPNGVCISVNKELVHGIAKDYNLVEGDLVSFDLGCTYDHTIADTAITTIYGQNKNKKVVELVNACKESLDECIKWIKIGKRLGVIGKSISKTAKKYGFYVVANYGGHGLQPDKPHCAPFVSNRGYDDEGIRICGGMSIAIEPMFVMREPVLKVSEDQWTVIANDLCAHFEHTIYVHDSGEVEVVTDG